MTHQLDTTQNNLRSHTNPLIDIHQVITQQTTALQTSYQTLDACIQKINTEIWTTMENHVVELERQVSLLTEENSELSVKVERLKLDVQKKAKDIALYQQSFVEYEKRDILPYDASVLRMIWGEDRVKEGMRSKSVKREMNDCSFYIDEGYEEMWDILVMCSDEVVVYCHKLFLSVRCRYFRSLFFGEFKEGKDKSVQIDVPSDAFKVVKKYLYTGKISVPSFLLFDIAICADFLDIPALLKHCTNCLVSSASVLNGASIYYPCLCALPLYRDKPFYQMTLTPVLEILRSNIQIFLQSNDFLYLSAENISSLLDSEELFLYEEIVLFENLIRWGIYQSERRGLTLKEVMNKSKLIETLVRFDLMSPVNITNRILTIKGVVPEIIPFENLVPYLSNGSKPIHYRGVHSYETSVVMKINPYSNKEINQRIGKPTCFESLVIQTNRRIASQSAPLMVYAKKGTEKMAIFDGTISTEEEVYVVKTLMPVFTNSLFVNTNGSVVTSVTAYGHQVEPK
eukprot:TRINITY_DN3615_c0_g1_i1.p1 TRINITY_DN3615_c0_g1~~TRINITY_DN3615_c0_g1_i1.p1  ORF type:complete len:512 (+),score=89.72 TRINITY_DN3615_c0_g1_i1:105-1640(+)